MPPMSSLPLRLGAVAVALAAAGAAAGCIAAPSDNGAGRPGPTSSPGFALPSGPPLTPPVTIPPGTASPGTPSATAATTGSSRVFGPTGLGGLQLGMTIAQAKQTRLIGPVPSPPAEGCVTAEMLAGQPGQGLPGLFFSPTLGLAAIYAYPGVKTLEGIGLGSTLAQVTTVYPSWQGLDGNAGHGWVSVPGSETAVYRIDIRNGLVDQLDIQLTAQDCYE